MRKHMFIAMYVVGAVLVLIGLGIVAGHIAT